ncbi:MAG: hypothetical protein HRU02_07000 [Myxococcales bacterium]|nr:hypothetical protein [Myxococcales bacterium]
MTKHSDKRILALVVALAAVSCASPNPPQTATNGTPARQTAAYPDIGASEPELPDVDAGPTIFQRASSAMEGALVGAVMGAQAGPLGAAVGAGTLLVYAAVTGEVPLVGASDPAPRDPEKEKRREQEMEDQIAGEQRQRGGELADQIEAELARQEDLLREIESEESATRAERQAPAEAAVVGARAGSRDSRAAPRAPVEPDLPRALFEERRIRVPRDAFGNERELRVTELSLDADRDGSPELLRYLDLESDELIRSEQDSDYDGRIDIWQDYAAGVLCSRRIDRDGDGRADLWEEYADGWATSRKLDRNGDGRANEYYQWRDGSLVVERHDADGDGEMNRIVRYQDRLLVRDDEDLDGDGRMDRSTTYATIAGDEVAVRIERDNNGDGSMDLIEIYAAVSGPRTLLRREEDRDADGRIDITSIYEKGRLVRREISDPALVPL